MKVFKVIPFHVCLIRALANDFNDSGLSWKELYSKIFLKDTDIYREFILTLHHVKINPNLIIDREQIIQHTNQFINVFIEDEVTKTLSNTKNDEVLRIPKSSNIKSVLAKARYIQLI